MQGGLIPANAKKSLLFLGFLRLFPDLVVLGSGTVVTVLLLALFGDSSPLWLTLFCVPMLICALLVMPIPNYHNTLCCIQSILRFFNTRRNYIWRGWCIYDEFKDNK